MLGAEIKVFGNVAVAMAACENTTITRNVEALLLVKEDGAWKIVSQAWDTESETNPVPAHLLC
jgi:hypothetical protein